MTERRVRWIIAHGSPAEVEEAIVWCERTMAALECEQARMARVLAYLV